MNKIRVLMIDDNKQLVDMVKEYFSSHAVIEVNLVANDGIEGLNVIEPKVFGDDRGKVNLI